MKGLAKEFTAIKKSYASDDKIRDQIIGISREILKPAKQAIYATHRDDLKAAKKLLTQAKASIAKVRKLVTQSTMDSFGSFRAALEEYTEAVLYVSYVESKSFPTTKELKVTYDTYLPALCDTSGELARRAVKKATEGDIKEVEQINQTLEQLVELFLNFDFRSGEMRKKFENLKYNLAKTQDILYDLQVRGKRK